jgi:hypothetical protein
MERDKCNNPYCRNMVGLESISQCELLTLDDGKEIWADVIYCSIPCRAYGPINRIDVKHKKENGSRKKFDMDLTNALEGF